MKLGWRFLAEPSTLWTRVLREKYCRGRELESTVTRPAACSNAWKGIIETMPLTEQGMGIALGDGRQTLFWHQRWLDGKRLIDHTVQTVPEDHINKRVCDYWSPNTGWDWSTLEHFLPLDILYRIASFDLSSEAVGDNVAWTANQSGKFTVKSAIRIIQAEETLVDPSWKTCWSIQVPQRIKYFLWLTIHQRILSNAERFRRHLLSTPQCNICSGTVEDLDHTLRHCTNAQGVWQELEAFGLRPVANNARIHSWLHENLRATPEDPEWPEKFAITLWYIWKWRCANCFGNTSAIPEERGEFLVNKYQEIRRALEQGSPILTAPSEMRTEAWVRWNLPPRDWKLMNTDGAVRGAPGPAGAGGVIRDETGTWIFGFSETVGHCSVLKAELRAILRGLKLAKEASISKLWINTDSLAVVNVLTNHSEWHTENNSIIQQCKQLLSWEGWETHLTHCYREANQVADMLAKIAIDRQLGVRIYREPPVEVRDIVHADSTGVFWPRVAIQK